MESTALTFLWPRLLWLLLALPLATLFYWALVRRRRQVAQQLASLETVGAEGTVGWRRSLPPLLWLLALAALLLAVARPQATITLPSRVETIILALDMSGSMKATDIAPTRMVAAREAATAFVNEQPDNVRIGVVGIAAAAAVVQSPTTKREDILAALERLEPPARHGPRQRARDLARYGDAGGPHRCRRFHQPEQGPSEVDRRAEK